MKRKLLMVLMVHGSRDPVVPGLIPCRCIIERLLVAKQRRGGARRGVSVQRSELERFASAAFSFCPK